MSIYKKISNGDVYIIAEMSANHAHKLENALEIVEMAKIAGADCLKIQTYTADTLTIDCNNEYFRINGGLWDGSTLYDLYKQAYTPWEWHKEIMDKCNEMGLDFLSTPFDRSSVDFLEEMNVQFYKIASFELVDIPLIKYVASKGKPIIMSCGMACVEEINEALEAVYSQGNQQVILLKCCSEYPTNYKDMNIATIDDMKKRFCVPVGLSDHSIGSLGAVTAVSIGACVVEKHLCLNRNIKNPDSKFSMEPKEFKKMVDDIKTVKSILGKSSYELSDSEKSSIVFRKSIFAVKDINEGETFSQENIRVIRPGYGIKPKYYDDIMKIKSGKKIKKGQPILFDCMQKNTILFLTNNDIAMEVYEWLGKRESVFLCKDKITLDFVKELNPSFIISYNYKHIIKGEIISFMKNRIINLHTSLLPFNRGASPNLFSFLENTPKGVTIHLIDKGIDTGDILCQKEIIFDEKNETFETSYNKLHEQIKQLFYDNWENIKNEKIIPRKQDDNYTYHNTSHMKNIQNKYPLCWSKNIYEYKKKMLEMDKWLL